MKLINLLLIVTSHDYYDGINFTKINSYFFFYHYFHIKITIRSFCIFYVFLQFFTRLVFTESI